MALKHKQIEVNLSGDFSYTKSKLEKHNYEKQKKKSRCWKNLEICVLQIYFS